MTPPRRLSFILYSRNKVLKFADINSNINEFFKGRGLKLKLTRVHIVKKKRSAGLSLKGEKAVYEYVQEKIYSDK